MANTKISALTDDPTPTGGNYFAEVDDTGGTPTTKRVSGSNLVKMGERNYKIVVTIASNNITIALKNLSGSDFSSTDPCIVKIGDTWRTITGALSVTVNAGTNTFNAGASELAAQEIDYFVYLGWRAASSAVVIGFSRIPWANVYSAFSGTATNEKYAAFSTAPASTDDVTVIGRISATLSAAASYNWTSLSQSAPTTENTIQKPIYKTRVLTWIPTWTNLTLGNGTQTARYQIKNEMLEYHQEVVFGSTSAISGDISHTLVMGKASHYAGALGIITGTALLRDAGTANYPANPIFSGSSVVIRPQLVSGTYASNVVASATVPFTWTTSDEVYEWTRYFIN